jgi:hypothetical protein
MRYATVEQSEGARAQKQRLFGLTRRALKFARIYGENNCTVTRAAREAGYSDRARGAHARGCELIRDPRVVRAILHFSALAVSRARADAIERLRELAEDKREAWQWSYWDRQALKRLRTAIDRLEPQCQRVERIYERGVLDRLPPFSR